MSSLSDIPFLSGYMQQGQLNRQNELGALHEAAGVQKLVANMRAQRLAEQQQQEFENIKPLIAQAGGDPTKAIQALLSTGNPKAIELAAKLKGMMPKPAEPYTLSPGAQRRGPNNELVAEAPNTAADERVRAQVEIARQRSEDQRLSRQEQLAARKELIQLTASLRQPPQPRNLQLTTDESGAQLIVNSDGTTTPLTTESGVGVRKPVGADKPMTEVQGKAAMYGTRAAQSDKVLKALEDKVSQTGMAIASAIPGGNFLMSSDQRRVDQAQRDFVNAVLRQESGAAIAQSEFDNAKKQYFPQPGDDKATIEQKRANRKLAVQGFARMAGPKGAPDIQAVVDNPLLPGVRSNPETPQESSGAIGGANILDQADAILKGKK